MWWEQVVHDDKVDFPSVRHFHSVQAVELRNQRIRIALNMLVVIRQDLAKQFVFGMMNGLDDIFVVAREVKKAAALSW